MKELDTNQELYQGKTHPSLKKNKNYSSGFCTTSQRELILLFSAQEFFAKKARRKGRWRVHVARLKVGVALARLRTAKRKQCQREKRHARAVEAYRVRIDEFFGDILSLRYRVVVRVHGATSHEYQPWRSEQISISARPILRWKAVGCCTSEDCSFLSSGEGGNTEAPVVRWLFVPRLSVHTPPSAALR